MLIRRVKMVEIALMILAAAAFLTESLWDVSVDTLEGCRRRGLAGACARALIGLLSSRGLEPVWAAVESNTASLRLAAKLGFERADRLMVFEKDFG